MTTTPQGEAVRVCPVKDIVCSTAEECGQRETGCKMQIRLPALAPPNAAIPSAEPAREREIAEALELVYKCTGSACLSGERQSAAAQRADLSAIRNILLSVIGLLIPEPDAAPPNVQTPSGEPVVLQITPGAEPPADCGDDGVQFCPHCNPCLHTGNAKCRSPSGVREALDAKRYRFLRQHVYGTDLTVHLAIVIDGDIAKVDEAVDTAIEREEREKKA